MNNKHRILITGSNGLLGQKLVVLLSQNPEVDMLATSSGENRLTGIVGLNYQSMDICNTADVLSAVQEYSPTVIINTAAMTQVDDCEVEQEKCYNINVHGVDNLLMAAEKVEAKLIHLSTDFIFDGEKGNYAEEDTPNPLSIYAKSKLDSELLLKNSRYTNWAIARTIIVYGVVQKMSRSNLVLWARKALLKGQEITVVDDQFRAPTLAEDLAEACWLMVKNDAKGIFHVSGPKTFSVIDLVRQVAEVFDLNKELVTPISSASLNQKAKRPPRTGFDISKAKTQLEYKPRTFMQGLEIVKSQLLAEESNLTD